MLRFHAGRFISISSLVTEVRHVVDEPNFKLTNPAIVRSLQADLTRLRVECERVGLMMTVDGIDRVLIFLKSKQLTGKQFNEKVRDLVDTRLEDEIGGILLLHVHQDRAPFFEKDDLFGAEVSQAFPSSNYDIKEAGTSFAVGRNTACVFHLMRALEVGLKCLGAQFGITVAHTNWHNVIDQIESAVGKLSTDHSKRAEYEYYSQVTSFFRQIKDAWRNYTMHAGSKYDDNEAVTMILNMRSFMQKLSERLHE